MEDSAADRRLIQEFFLCRKLQCQLDCVGDGAEAMDYLNDSEKPTPDLILLDLNLPKRDGREVLAFIKESDRLKHIPVVVFTTSDDERDVTRCYNLHANAYLVKPVDLEEFQLVMDKIENFWLETALLSTSRECA